jgi:AP-3 complex subunit delta-1
MYPQDLTSNPADIAAGVNGLSHFISPDLARDLSNDLVAMLNHSRPHIRKRAVVAVYKMLVKYPQASPYALTRLKEKLEDPDLGASTYDFAPRHVSLHGYLQGLFPRL